MTQRCNLCEVLLLSAPEFPLILETLLYLGGFKENYEELLFIQTEAKIVVVLTNL